MLERLCTWWVKDWLLNHQISCFYLFLYKPHINVSQPGVSLSTPSPAPTSSNVGDIFGCHTGGVGVEEWGGSGGTLIKGATKYPTVHKTTPHNKELPSLKCQWCPSWETLTYTKAFSAFGFLNSALKLKERCFLFTFIFLKNRNICC